MTEDLPFIGKLTVKYPWNKTSGMPEITGMPPDVLILSKFERLQEDMAQLKEDIATNFSVILRSELDEKEVGGLAYGQVLIMVNKANEMMKKMDSMMERYRRLGRLLLRHQA